MVALIYFGVRLPDRPYERIEVDDVIITNKILEIKEKAEKLLNCSSTSLEFIYCGLILDNEKTLQEQNVKYGSTIHIFPKQLIEPKAEPISEEVINKAVYAFRSIFLEASFHKVVRPEVVKKALHEYPEFYTDLGSFAILKDPILIGKIKTFQFATKYAEHYPTIIRASEFITNIMWEYMKTMNKTTSINWHYSSSSDVESPSESESPLSTQNIPDNRINRGQLATALMLAGSASLNSGTNIASRNTSDRDLTSTSPSTTIRSTADTLTQSALMNALSHVLMEPRTNPNPVSTVDYQQQQQQQFAVELHTMREMGLMDESINLQALMLCNGEVEAAINLVLAGMGSFS